MKKIYIRLLAAAVVVPGLTLTSCIEETFPTTLVTQDQVVSSPDAAASFAMGMPAFMNTYNVLGLTSTRHYDFGYPAMMHIRDVMTGDMPILASPSGYDWFDAWELNEYQATDNIYPQLIWNTYNQLVQTANLTIGSVDPNTENAQSRYYLGAGLAYRAMAYLDMARMFEYLPCDATEAKSPEGNDILGLTVPIVTESMSEAEARVNPRATHEEMMEFLISDLDAAETYITATDRIAKNMPDLACVYGLKARAYLWDGDYSKAKEYAAKAIAQSGASITTEAQWLSTTTGFNSLSIPSWMWGGQYTSEDGAVKTSLVNWASWASNEALWGYSSAEPNLLIDARLYSSISDDDFRKRTFVAPEGSAMSGKENWINKAAFAANGVADLAPYSSLKIKPNNGEMISYLVGGSLAYPLMRVEEMYFIEMEAAANLNPTEGRQLLNTFMKNRNPNYSFTGSSAQQVIDEIFLQKRIEFYGEGQILFDYKRLNKPVTRYYEGTNWREDVQFNTTTRPAWMNFVIVQTEGNNNSAVRDYNNPNPSSVYPSLGSPKE